MQDMAEIRKLLSAGVDVWRVILVIRDMGVIHTIIMIHCGLAPFFYISIRILSAIQVQPSLALLLNPRDIKKEARLASDTLFWFNSPEITEVREVEYKPNRALAFFDSPISYHGVRSSGRDLWNEAYFATPSRNGIRFLHEEVWL